MSLQTVFFNLGPEHSVQEWGSIVATLAVARKTGEQVVEQTYLDTMDWAIASSGLSFLYEKVGQDQQIRIINDDDLGKMPRSLSVENCPKWPQDLPEGKVRKKLNKLCGLRSLLPLAYVKSEQIILHVEDAKDRQRLRLIVECNFYRSSPRGRLTEMGRRLRIEAIAGYEKEFARTISRFAGMQKQTQAEFFHDLMARAGRTPFDYSAKFKINLDRDMRADSACKMILLNQLDQIERNIDGTIEDIDSEFLHDLRVAVRRSRSALNRLKGVLPQTVQDKFGAELAWIGSITTPVRDLDVYLIDYPKYRDQLRAELQTDLAPLYDFLVAHHKTERAELIKNLKSRRFKDFLSKWRIFLEKPVPARPTAPAASQNIRELADARIWKTYRKVITEGKAITQECPAEALHDLRKTCKKLRYVLEFFASLYDEQEIKHLVKTLKVLQENLGVFQDLDVQADTLHQFSEDMLKEGQNDARVYMAMGVLVEQFLGRKSGVRAEFTERFAAFSSKENKAAFRKLVGRDKPLHVSVAQNDTTDATPEPHSQ